MTLHEAITEGDAASVAERLERDSQSIHDRDSFGRTPLVWAICNANTEIVTLLLQCGADPNERSDESPGKLTLPLAVAAQFNNTAIVQLLLDAGADPTAVDNDATPLYHAVWGGALDVLELFAKIGIKPPPGDPEIKRAAKLHRQMGNTEQADYLKRLAR